MLRAEDYVLCKEAVRIIICGLTIEAAPFVEGCFFKNY